MALFTKCGIHIEMGRGDRFIPRFSTIEEAEGSEQIQVDEINNDTVIKHI